MSCLLPQFRCLPDTFSANFKSQTHSATHPSKSRDPICFRTQCILSTGSTTVLELEKLQLPSLEPMSNSVPVNNSSKPSGTTSVLDLEKLKLPSLDVHSNSVAANRPWTYLGAVGLATEANFQASLATETLITSEEAVIAAAASEALALAKAAVKVAKEAAMMASNRTAMPSDCETTESLPEVDNSLPERNQLAHFVERVNGRDSEVIETGLVENHLASFLPTESDVEPSLEELELLEAQLSKSIAVRSNRQTERKVRRAKAAEKAAANVVSVRSGSVSRKKLVLREIDHNDPLRYIRGTTSNSKLLTAAEERTLSAGVQDLLKLESLQEELIERYGDQLTFAQWAAAADVDQRTLRKRLNYGTCCKEKMITSNIRLVVSIAKHYHRAGLCLQDLVQEGCRGLVRGVEKFDASKGFKFSTYAHWWIKQAVRRSLSEHSRLIRLPFHMVEASYKVKEARKLFFNDHGRQPDDKELAKAAGLSLKRLQAVLMIPKAPISLDRKIGIDKNLDPQDVIADPNQKSGDELLMEEFMNRELAHVLNTLNRRERQVIRLRYGLEDGRMMTLQEIGELLGVCRERIRQIELCALRKLKSKKRSKNLRQYVMP